MKKNRIIEYALKIGVFGSYDMVTMMNESVPLGGKSVIVEIDESKFGKTKYGGNRPVDGQWIFGGIERGTNKCFFKVVDKRNKDTLLPII